MGLLSSLKGAVSSVVKGTKELLSGGITQLPKNIVQRVEDKIDPIVGARPFTPEEKTIIKTTGVAAAALAAAPVAIAAAPVAVPIVAKAATSLVSTPTRAITTAVVAPVVATAVVSNPIGTVKTIEKTVSAQVDLGKVIANPSIESAKNFVLDHPLATAAGVVAAGVVTAKVVAPVVSGLLTKEAINEQTEAIKDIVPLVSSSGAAVSQPTSTAPVLTQSKTSSPEPVTPKTEPLLATTGGGTSSTNRRKRRAVKPQEQRISQRVNVIVANKATSRQTNKYLNRPLLNRL